MAFNIGSVVYLALCLLPGLLIGATMGLFNKNNMPVEGKVVLITGGSEGMGLSAAQQLAAKGASVIIVSRSPSKLSSALELIRASAKSPTQRFHSIPVDVSVPDYAPAVIAEAKRWNNGQAPDIVWCVAGTSVPELFLDMDMASMRRQMDINFFGTAEMCQAILKEWLAEGNKVEEQAKHLVMTTSAVIFYMIPGYIPYAPSKFAMRGLAEGLSRELMLYPQNVKVHLVCPGTILSPGFEKEEIVKPQVTKEIEAKDPRQTPEEVAAKAIAGLEKGNFMITINPLNKVMQAGSIGSAIRSNIFDGMLAATMALIVWPFVHMDIHGQIKSYAKKHGHPASYKKNVK